MSKKITIDAGPLVDRLNIKAESPYQQASLENLLNTGFPTAKVEAWKYTRIDALLESDFKIVDNFGQSFRWLKIKDVKEEDMTFPIDKFVIRKLKQTIDV